MASKASEADDFIIKIPKHLWKDAESVHPDKTKKIGFDILVRTGVSVVLGKRDTGYGETEIQTFALGAKEYRENVLRLLSNPALYTHTSKILQYIYEMGCDSDGEKRYFASVAISELSNCFPFADLETTILTKWARGSTFNANRSAALALVHMIENSPNQHNALNLLKFWSRQSNVHLVNTIILVLYESAKKYPQESLEAIESILLDKEALLRYTSVGVLSYSFGEDHSIKISWEAMIWKIFRLIEELYVEHALRVIETLYQWFQNRKNPNLAIVASIAFLSITSVKDIATDEVKRTKVVVYLYELWEDKKLLAHPQLQQRTTNVVYQWAKIILEMKKDDPNQLLGRQFFHDLYKKCESAKQNRLHFHLVRWQNQFNQNKKSTSSQQLDFLSLIPESTQV